MHCVGLATRMPSWLFLPEAFWALTAPTVRDVCIKAPAYTYSLPRFARAAGPLGWWLGSVLERLGTGCTCASWRYILRRRPGFFGVARLHRLPGAVRVLSFLCMANSARYPGHLHCGTLVQLVYR